MGNQNISKKARLFVTACLMLGMAEEKESRVNGVEIKAFHITGGFSYRLIY